MPVFSVMAPVVHEQYAGGGGGTGALAQGGPPSSGVGGAAQLNQEPNPLIADEYQQALLRAVRMAGLNPSSLNPNVSKVMSKGKQLVNELLANLGTSGNYGAATSAPDMLNMLAGLIRSAITGGKVFGGSEKESALSNLMGLVNQGATGSTGSVGGDFLAQLLADPGSASNLFSEVRYGNLAEPFQRTGAHALLGLLDQFYQQQQANPAGMPNFLATLLGGASGATSSLGAGSTLPSGLGAPAAGAPGGAPTGGPGLPQQPISPAAAAAGLGQGAAFPGYQLPAPGGFGQAPNPLLGGAAPTDPTAQLQALAQSPFAPGGSNPYLGY